MLTIDLRNPAVIGYRYSVVGNNNVDVVCFVSSFVQYATGYKVFVKVEDDERTYVDKIEIASEDITVEEDTLKVQWTMGEVSTQCKRINVQLQFENNDGTLIDQSLIAKITLADSINVDEEASHIYPKVLEDLQEQINEIKANKRYIHYVYFGYNGIIQFDGRYQYIDNKPTFTFDDFKKHLVDVYGSSYLAIAGRTAKTSDNPPYNGQVGTGVGWVNATHYSGNIGLVILYWDKTTGYLNTTSVTFSSLGNLRADTFEL